LACLISFSAHGREQEKSQPRPRATIVIYRTPGFVGVLVTHVPRVNGSKAARLKAKTYTTLSVAPGDVTICIFGDNLCIDRFQAVAGETYYVRDTSDAQYAGSGATAFSIYLQRVDAATAAEQIPGLKQVEPEVEFR